MLALGPGGGEEDEEHADRIGLRRPELDGLLGQRHQEHGAVDPGDGGMGQRHAVAEGGGVGLLPGQQAPLHLVARGDRARLGEMVRELGHDALHGRRPQAREDEVAAEVVLEAHPVVRARPCGRPSLGKVGGT